MYVIGLTGGIASGKSTAADTLRQLGAEVIDADAISRELTSPGGEAENAIFERFGTVNRRRLAGIVFYDEQARHDLNAIVHPLVTREIKARIRTSRSPVVVLDVPLLFEAKMEYLADEVWVMHVPREEQVRRIMERDGLSREDAIARVDSQMSTALKVARADAAIESSGTIAQTRMQIEDLWQETLHKIGETPAHTLYPSAVRRQRRTTRMAQQRELEAQASIPVLSRTVPMEPAPAVQDEDSLWENPAWEDTSTLLDIPEQRTFFSRQPRLFWIVAAVLLVSLLVVVGVVGSTVLREAAEERAEAQRIQQLAEEKARYKLVYRDLIEEYAIAQGIDPAYVAAIIYNESRFKPEAVSHLGARGLMQVMEKTGEWIAEKLGEKANYTFDLMFEPEANIRYGTWYLGFLKRLFGSDITKVTAAYHAGQGSVEGWLANPEYSSDGVTLKHIPFPETEQYVERVKTAYQIYKKHYYTPQEVDTNAENNDGA